MAVNSVKTSGAISISNSQEANDHKQRESERKNPSKKNKLAVDAEARREEVIGAPKPDLDVEQQIKSQPIDTEKVLELLSQKQESNEKKAQVFKLPEKKVEVPQTKKVNKIC